MAEQQNKVGVTTGTEKIRRMKKRIRIVQGGTSASKTYSIIFYLIDLALRDKKPTLTSIVSESFPHLRRGAMRDFLVIMKGLNYFKDKLWSKTEYTYTFETGSKIEFFSVDQPEKVRGARRDRLFINEANNVSFDSFEQLEVRTKDFIFIDYNPTSEFWVFTDVIGKRDDIEQIVLTYLDNEALSKDIIDSIEQRKNRKGWWKVYGLGELGEIEGKIYNSWKIIDEVPHEAKLKRYGLNFGYCVDNQTEILTKKGWKTYDILTENDNTLTLNPVTGKSEWQKVDKVNVFNGRYEMWNIEGQSHSSFTTHNHRWLVEKKSGRKFKTTETLGINDKILCSAECNNLSKKRTYSDSFVELMAWFWTEGQITDGGISIWQNEGENTKRIRKCLKDEFGEILTRIYKNGICRNQKGYVVERPKRDKLCHFAINHKGAKRFLELAPNKIVANEFINRLTKDQLQLFVDISIEADGWIANKGTRVITQNKKERLEPLQIVCSLLGIRTTFKDFVDSYGGQQYRLTLFKNNDYLNIGELIKRRKSYKRYIAEGTIWCPTIKNGTWLARRKGTCYFTGNTNHPAALVAIYYYNGGYIIDEIIYGRGLSNQNLADSLKNEPKALVVADSAEPKSIDEIKSYQINVIPAQKGKDSVVYGIGVVQEERISVTKRSVNVIREYRNYLWQVDRDGRVLNDPEEPFHYSMDAVRYPIMSLAPVINKRDFLESLPRRPSEPKPNPAR